VLLFHQRRFNLAFGEHFLLNQDFAKFSLAIECRTKGRLGNKTSINEDFADFFRLSQEFIH
jgi:hypothetical protein